MVIGLTGQIGAGKSTAADILRSMGAAVIDADAIGRLVVEKSAQLRKQLAHQFGEGILTPTGNLRRKKLAALAFASDESKRKLNDLVHPYLLKELRTRLSRARKKVNLVVVDAALLLYWNLDREVDHVLVIHASQAERLQRLEARGISRTDALARQRAQLPYSEFRLRADTLLLNNRSREDLRHKIEQTLLKISRPSH